MKYLLDKVKKLYVWDYFPFIILALGMFLFHFSIDLGWGDDSYYITMLNKNNLNILPFIVNRYYNWSSRLIIESFLIILVHFEWLWRILDTAIMVLIAVSISKLIPSCDTRLKNWIITSFVFIYPINHMNSAGWIATTMNYSWPLAFGLFSMIPIKKILFDEEIKNFEYIFYILAILFALNQEQMCAIIFSVYLVFTVYLFFKKKPNLFMIIQSLLSIISMIFILTCPGNYARKIAEVGKWFPEYPNISFLQKTEIGYSSALFEFIMTPNKIFTLFSGLLLICTIITKKKSLHKIIAVIPLASNIIFGYPKGLLLESSPIIAYVKYSITEYGTGFKIFSIDTWLPDYIITLVLICILFSLYIIFDNKKYSILLTFIFLLGFASRFIMAFSPTIWASRERTFIFMYFSIIICSVILFQVILDSKSKKFIAFSTGIIGSIATFEYLNLIF
ncbi:DUF6056 family protein [Acetivibrio clariflavus]|nr:DUF6056 family protein [Acetivibrio clariflavus]